MRAKAICLCSEVIKVETKVKFIILMHPHEFKKVKNNTGRLTHLSLINSELIMSEGFNDNRRVNELISTTDSYILYPGIDSISSNELQSGNKRPITVFIIDATWPCSKKLLRLSPNLRQLKKISFETKEKSIYQIKRQPKENFLSTIESTRVLLSELNEAGIENIPKAKIENFLAPFKKLIQIQIDYINNPNLEGYRRTKKDS